MNTDQKIDAIFSNVNQIRTDLTKYQERQEQMRKEIDEQKEEIDTLVALKNKGIGISIVLGTGVGAFLTYVFRHF